MGRLVYVDIPGDAAPIVKDAVQVVVCLRRIRSRAVTASVWQYSSRASKFHRVSLHDVS